MRSSLKIWPEERLQGRTPPSVEEEGRGDLVRDGTVELALVLGITIQFEYIRQHNDFWVLNFKFIIDGGGWVLADEEECREQMVQNFCF